MIKLVFCRASLEPLARLAPARLAPLGATALSAALYAASFPPLSLWWLAWIALVPWLAVLPRRTPAGAAALGFAWGVLVACCVAAPLPGLLARYLEIDQGAAWVSAAAIATTMFAPYYAAFAAWLAWTGRRGRAGPLVVAAGWTACELARGRFIARNPWALDGYSQVASPVLIQVADVVGVYGLGGLIALVNAVLAGVAAAEIRGRRPIAVAALGASLILATWIYGSFRLAGLAPEATSAAPDPITVAVIQPATWRGASWRPEYQRHGLDANLVLTERVRPLSPDLVVWPEAAVSFYPDERSPESAALIASTKAAGFDLLLGAPHYAFTDGATVYHNSAYLLRDGEIADRYDKRRLVPVAEAPLFGFRDERIASYTPGDDPSPLAARRARLGVSICFESMYPELVAASVASGAEVLVNLSNDSWMGSPAAARQHFDMARLRAIESRRWLVRAATTGISAVVDPTGRIATAALGERPEALVGTIDARRERTPYQRFGDTATVLLASCGIAASLLPDRRSRPLER